MFECFYFSNVFIFYYSLDTRRILSRIDGVHLTKVPMYNSIVGVIQKRKADVTVTKILRPVFCITQLTYVPTMQKKIYIVICIDHFVLFSLTFKGNVWSF